MVAGPSVPPARAAGSQPLREVAKLPSEIRFETRVLTVDAPAGRLFEIGQPDGPSIMRVVARDLKTFERIGRIDLPSSQSGFGGRLAAVDPLHHRLFVLYPYRVVDDEAAASRLSDYPRYGRLLFAMGVIDTLRFRLLGVKVLSDLVHAPPQDAGVGNSLGIKAMSYYAAEDKIYLVTEDTTGRVGEIQPGDHAVFLHQIDVGRLLDQSSSVQDWIYPIPHCPMVMAKPSTGIVLRSTRASQIFIVCRTGNILEPQAPGDVGGIVRVNIRPNATQDQAVQFTSDFFPISGKLSLGLVALDPVSERILLATDVSSAAPRIWVFDAPSASWLGFVVSLPLTSLGVDPTLGRYYGLSNPFFGTNVHRPPALAIVGSTRGDGVDQGVLTSFKASGTVQGGDALVVDPVEHRLFWAGYDDPEGAHQYYMVIKDGIPVPAPIPAARPDDNTIDAPEGPGTAVNFLGGARAYGSRVRLVGGWRAIERNTTTFSANVTPYPPTCSDPTGFGQAPPLPIGLLPGCPSEGTRDVHFARVMRAILTGGEATAEAAGGDRDTDNTDRDLLGWTTYLKDRGGPDLTDRRWPYPAADCADFGGEGSTDARRGSAVACARDRRSVKASAENSSPIDFSLPSDVDVVRVAASWAKTSSMTDRIRGVVSVAEAEARGIQIGDGFGIGRVYARAETWATGRPKRGTTGGAGSRYKRIIEDVWTVSQDGSRQTVCSSPCSPELVAATITRVFGARVNISLPTPDPELARGTPGGYEALVARNGFERLNDVSQNGETDIRLEVPSIVVTVFADGSVSSRLVLSLAGVSTESHYGIYRLARDEPAPPPGRTGSVAPTSSGSPSTGTRRTIPGKPARTMIERFASGLHFIVATPVNAIRGFGLWGFLLAPVVLMVRRRRRQRT